MTEAQLKEAIMEYLGEAPSYLKMQGNRYANLRQIVEQTAYEHAHKRAKGVRIKIAKYLGINRNTLYKRYGKAISI